MDNLDHRKMSAVVRVLDENGMPLANTKVRCELTRHSFLFGCGAFDAVPFADMSREDTGYDAARTRMRHWLDLFNYGTLPFYWGRFEPKEGETQTAQLSKAAQYLKSKGVVLKGHPLCWHTSCAGWLLKYSDTEILQKQIDRVRRETERFAGLIDMWDVINEVVIMLVYDRYDNAVTRICKLLGRVRLIKTLFEAARETDPGAKLLINDFNMSQSYEILIDGCLNAGVPIDAIGLQSHQHQGVWGREKTENVLSRFEHFGLPIHFTENTIVAGPYVDPALDDLQDAHYEDDAATPEYEQMQAAELEKMYRLLFEEHPLVTAITNWSYSDGGWLNAPSGVIRRDGSLKPAYCALRHLIRDEWHTDVTLLTDDNGCVDLNGFKGNYCITSGNRSGTAVLTESGKDYAVKLS